MKLKHFILALVAMLSGFSFTASAQELLVNCDYNSNTEGYGTSKFSNYAGAYAYATGNGKTSATIVIEKTNTASGNCIENNHKNYKNLKVVVNDGGTLWVAISKWDMTYPVTVKPGGAIKSARPTAAGYINTHIKSTLTLGEAGASKKATIDFLDGKSYQSGSLAVLYNGKIVANNATIEVGDLGCTGTATFNDCNITIEGVLATGKNNYYKQSMSNTTVTVGGANRMNENTYYSTAGTLLHNLTLDNSTIAVGNGDGVVVKTVTLKNGSAWTVAEGANINTTNAKVTVYGSVEVPEELANNSTANELVSNTAVSGYTPTLPAGVTNLTVELTNIEATSEETTKVTFNVEPKNASGNKVSETSEITFRLPVPSAWAGKEVVVYHDGEAMPGTYTVQSGNYIEVKSTAFSEFAVELFEPVAKIGETGYATFADALAAAEAMTGDVTVEIYEKVTLNGPLTGSYSSIKFVGKADAAEIYLDIQGYIEAAGKKVAFVNLILSKSQGGFINNAGFMNVAFGVYNVVEVTYTNCTFANGAYASAGKVTFTSCTFKRSHDKYGLWAYGNVDVTVDGCKFADYRGIKMYAENGANASVEKANLTVKNTDFRAVDNKPAIVLTYGESVVLEGNTYSSTGTFELDLDGKPNGVAVTSDVAPVCVNDNGACGVLVDGKIYTTVAQAAAVATSGSNVTLLHDSAETVEFPMGATLNKNNFEAAGVTVAQPFAEYVVLPISMTVNNYKSLFGTNTVTDGTNYYATLQAAVEAVEAVAGQANKVLYCKPGADVGSLQHAPVTSTLTVYGNGANVTGGAERDFDLGNTDPNGGRDITADMTLTVKYLNGCGAWGAKATEHTVNLVFENCANMGKVFITGSTGTLNITMTDCAFKGVIKEAVYSNADGAITLNNVAFSNLNKAINLNHKAAGTQTVTINGCSFTNCGADVAADQIPVRVLSSVEGGKSVLAVSNSTFTGTPAGGADILLDYGVGTTEATVASTTANVVVEKENNVGTKTEVSADNSYEFTNAKPVAMIGETGYATLAAAIEAAQAGDEIVVIADVADVTVDVTKNLTISGSVTLNNVGINANGADALTVKGLTFTGNSWINSGTAEALTVSGVTATVAPSNTAYTNSRSAFISLGRSEQQTLALTVDGCDITVKSQGPDAILGWAAITEATITNNVIKGSSDGYFWQADAIKFMAIAAGAEFVIKNNEIWSNYNGIVFGQNTTRANAYSVYADANKFVGGADHIWIEVSGANTVHATVNATSANTVNGNAFTINNINHSNVIKIWSSYAGVDVVTNENGKVIGGTLASYSNKECIAEGYELNAEGKVVEAVYAATINGVKYTTLGEAVAALKDGETLTITSDITSNNDFIELNGKTNITLTAAEGVVINGNIQVGYHVSHTDNNVDRSASTFTVDGLTVNGTLTALSNDANLVVKNSEAAQITVKTYREGMNIAISGNTVDGSMGAAANSYGMFLVPNATDYNLTVDSNTFKNVNSHAFVVQGCGDGSAVTAANSIVVTNNNFESWGTGGKTNRAAFKIWADTKYAPAESDLNGTTNAMRELVIAIAAGNNTYSSSANNTVQFDAYGAAGNAKDFPAPKYAVAQIGDVKYATLAAAVAAVQEGETITILAGTISEGTIKLPATLKNVTIKGETSVARSTEGAILKDMTITAADGNTVNYEGLTFDGIIFDNSNVVLTGWRTSRVVYKNITVNGCTFKNVVRTNNEAAFHINCDATEAVNGFTFTNNVIDGVSGASNSGIYAQVTGEVVVSGNVINNVAFRPYVIQVTTNDGVADEFIVTDNTFSGSAAGRAQGLGNNATGTDAVNLVVSGNIFKDITNAQQICYWNFNAAKTTADLSKNYYDIDIEANPGKIYYNSAATSVSDLLSMGVFPIYTELNEDGTINTASAYYPPVAKIGETTYATLAAAVAAAQAGNEIVLIADVKTTDGVVITDKNLTIDLNGKTYTVTEGANTNNRNFKINGTSVVTVKNGTMVAEGEYSSGAYGTIRTEGTANVTLTGLKLYNYRGNGLNIKACAGTTVTIENTEIYANYGGGIESAGGTIVVNDGVTVKQEGMYTAPYNSMAISVNGGGKVTVNGGTFSTECITAEEANNQGTSHGPWVAGVLNSGGTLIINGGTFSNDNFGENSLATAARGAILADTGAKIEINGGTFNALNKIIDIQNNLGDASKNPSAVLVGGEFSSNPTNGNTSNCITVKEGYMVDENNGVWNVVKAVAKIDEKGYATLQAAINAVQDGETITLVDNVTISAATAGYTDGTYTDGVRYTGDKSFTVDFNGKTVTDDGCVNDYLIYINNKGEKASEITFTNGTIVSANGCWSAVCVNSSAATQNVELNLNGMNITNSNDAVYSGNPVVRVRTLATVNVNDGTIITSNGASYGVAANTDGSTVNINEGATIVQQNSGTTGGNSVFAAVGGKGVINIKGGTITSDRYGVHTMTTGTPVINISGGTITAPVALKSSTNGGNGELATINVTGGTINGTLETYTDNGKIVVSGGTFSEAVAEEYCAEGFIPAVNADGTYGVVEAPKGSNFNGYTSTEGIWGEVWGNARESFVIKVLDANSNVMGTTSLNNVGGIIDGDVTVSWNLKFDAASNTDEYWTMAWTTAPSISNMPAKVELWVDGTRVSGGDVVLNGPDNLWPIAVAVTDENGVIKSCAQTLEAAVAAAQAGETVVLLKDVEVASSSTITLDGVNVATLEGVTLTNNGAFQVKGEVSLNIATLAGSSIDFLDGAIIKNSTIGGNVFVAGNVTFRGANTFAMLSDFGTLTDYYGTTAPMKWTVEEGASVTLTTAARYGLGYGDDVTVYGNIENALTAREALTDADRSLFMHGLVAQESKGWNCDSKFTVEDAYVAIGSNNSFGNKPGNYGGTYTFNIKNSVVDASRITFYEALSTTTFTIENSDVKMGTFMTRDADSKFTLKNSKVLSTTTSNGTDEGNYNKGELTLENSKLTYSAELKHEAAGVINLDINSLLTAPKLSGAGAINVNATGISVNVTVIKADMSDFSGTITVEGGKYEITDEGLVVKAMALDGAGTETSPYLINNVDDLVFFRDHVNAGETKYNAPGVYVALGANIDLAGIDWSVNIGDDCSATFDGIFDGKNYTISNLTTTETAAKADGYFCTGLFGAIYGNAVVKNFTIENVNINTGDFTGNNAAAVVGFAYNATGSVENVTVTGDIQINAKGITGTGAIVGYAYNSSLTVKGCQVIGDDDSAITGAAYVGGIIGYSTRDMLTGNTVENIDITATSCATGGVAGIMLTGGQATNNTVKNVNLVSSHANWQNAIGAVVGTITGNVTIAATTVEGVNATALAGAVHADKPATPVAKVAAKIGDVYYTTLDAALATEGEATVELLVPYVVAAGETVTLDLNGKTVTMETADDTKYCMILNYGTLTIEGEGKLSYKYTGTNSADAYNTVESAPGSVLTVKNGTIENLSENCLIAYAIDGLTNANHGNVTVNIEGGNISSKKIAVRIFANSTTNTGYLNIDGGVISGRVIMQNASAKANKAELNITGGTFNTNGYKADVLNIGTPNGDVAAFTAAVSGGTFNGDIISSINEGFISGGSFSSNVTEFVAFGYECVANANGTYGVQQVEIIGSLTLIDGQFTKFENDHEITVGTLTYQRTFKFANKWQSLYVPFEIPVGSLKKLGYDVAYLYDVHNTIVAGDEIDPSAIESVHFVKINEGKLKANYPYIIRPTSAAELDLVLELSNVKLYSTLASEMTSVESSTTTTRYIFAGTYTTADRATLTGDDNIPCLAVSNSNDITKNGGWIKMSATASLTPFRVFMYIVNKDGSPVIVTEEAARAIRICIVGEEEEEENEGGTTIIYDVEMDDQTVDYIYDLQGRRVLEPQKGNLYIINGKKVIF